MELQGEVIVVRGGGDIATGVIHKLWSMGKKVLVLETAKPAAIRRLVAFSEAIYNGEMIVEGAKAIKVEEWEDSSEIEAVWDQQAIPIVIDPEGRSIVKWKPTVVIDAIIAKKNLGTRIEMAPLTIGLGPGFEAGKDVHIVIETMRGPSLGEIITNGKAIPNTGVPGKILGVDKDRVIHAPIEGILHNIREIGDLVEKGETIAYIEGDKMQVKIEATINGVLRGLIRDGYQVKKGFKIADIDPRQSEIVFCNKITDKAKTIAKSVEIVLQKHRT